MFFIKKIFFKFMELGLGLNTYFNLETKNPIFINFKLSGEEAKKVKNALAPGFELQKIRFSDEDNDSHYWLSYNFYEIKYPKKELAKIRKVRCEINTFVTDPKGRKGIYVFSGSPFISREKKFSVLGFICDLAEKMVTFIYGCGKLIPLTYELDDKKLLVYLSQNDHLISVSVNTSQADCNYSCRLSTDYLTYNDISFFNNGKTFDLVHTNSVFALAKFDSLESRAISPLTITSPFFSRAPDHIYFHLGELSYLVAALNRMPKL